MKPFYRYIISDAWQVGRRHLFLWPLAFFSSFVFGAAATFQIFWDIYRDPTTSPLSLVAINNEADFLTSIFVGWSSAVDRIPWAHINLSLIEPLIALLIYLVFILILVIIVIASEGGLMHALSQLEQNKPATYMASFRWGLDKAWQIFSVNLVYRLIYLMTLALLVLPLIYIALAGNDQSSLLFKPLTYMVFVPILIILDLVTRYTLLYIVIKNQKIHQALYNAWLLFRANWIISLETALVILTGLIVFYLAMTLIALPVLKIFLIFFGTLVSSSAIAFKFVSLVAVFTIALVIAFFTTSFSIFQMSIWVGVFNRLNSDKQYSKIHRVLAHLPWLQRKVI